MATAAIYARKSKLTETGASIDTQIKICRQYLETQNIEKCLIYRDEGFSGKNIDRPEFLKMIEDAHQKKFSILICYKIDRISRNVSDFSNLVNELEKLGISFISVNEQFDTSSAMGRAMMLICSVFAQLERETISLRVRDNMCALAEVGNWLGGEPPTGFESTRVKYFDENNKEKTFCILTPNKEEMELIKFIYDKYLQLKSLNKLRKYLLTNNIKTRYGKDWSLSSLNSILTNPVYVRADNEILKYFSSSGIKIRGSPDGTRGILIYNKRNGKCGKNREKENWIYSVTGSEGILDSADWLKVQNQIAINKSKAIPNKHVKNNKQNYSNPSALGSSHTALLSGLVRCAKCNNYMRVTYGKENIETKTRKYYYVCSLKISSGKTRCNCKNIDGLELDNMIVEKLKEMSVDKNSLISEVNKFKNEIMNSIENVESKNLQYQIKQNKTMIENLINNVSLTNDKTTAQMLVDQMTQLNKETDILEKQLEAVSSETNIQNRIINHCDVFMKYIKDFAMAADTASFEKKKNQLAAIIERVYVNGDNGDTTLKFRGVDEI